MDRKVIKMMRVIPIAFRYVSRRRHTQVGKGEQEHHNYKYKSVTTTTKTKHRNHTIRLQRNM